jgi:predicted ATPase
MINKIAVENFRVFKHYTEFELRPLTLLTGPNNAGKSSLTKLLLLFNEGKNKLNFNINIHNLKSYEEIINRDNHKEGNNKLKINTFIKNDLFGDCYSIEYSYSGGNLQEISIKNNDILLLKFDNYEPEEEWENENCFGFGFEFNINYLIDLILAEEINLPNYDLSKFEDDYLLYNIKDENLNIDRTDEFKDKLLKIQDEAFKRIKIQFDVHNEHDKIKEFKENVKKINGKVKEEIKRKIEKIAKSSYITIEENTLGNYIFNDIIIDKKKLLDYIAEIKASDFSPLHYVSPARGSQERIINTNNNSEISKTSKFYNETTKKFEDFEKLEKYFRKVEKIFELPGKIKVDEIIEKDSSLLELKIDGQSIADYGFGYSQLVPILLKIYNCTIIFPKEIEEIEYNPIIIIEEPEANLHPKLQSKLADFFVLTINNFPGFRFIIETHSEYFIRKLQYLTALNESYNNEDLEKSISPDKSIIYYFNDKKFVNTQEPKVKKIEIRKDGNLSETFGPGFYDEATVLKFDLIKLSKSQFN